ncbi:hypothetical protein [uncultured Eubacterium sp.]|uniref:hypothetical protein n=1 Tax=uncultured Eubacterium sp. TaxID=165185 RepID=UPI002613BA76|nr:hypothetical protein [uncultured Eubacterium sp.]
MKITRENIVEDSTVVSINWLRENTPFTRDRKELAIDSAEFELKYDRIERLERNIENDDEFIMCFVHFKHKDREPEGIYFSVWDNKSLDEQIVVELSENEKKILFDYAKEKIDKRY